MRGTSVALVLALVACGDDGGGSGGEPPLRWTCPADWVPHAAGGCGPAVLLCAEPRSAAAGACGAIDLAVPAASTGFHRLDDGRIGGRWPEHDATGEGSPPSATFVADVPPADFVPDGAGIDTCAAGWTRAADGTCDAALRTDCPVGAGPLPGGDCTRTADADCPATPFADVSAELGAARVIHVRAGADASVADGTAALPFATLDAALAAAADGDFVLLAAGTYDSTPTITTRVSVVGACATRVLIRDTSADERFTVGAGGALDLRGVALDSPDSALFVTGGGTATVQGVRVESSTDVGIDVEGVGSSLDASDVVFDDTGGRGVQASMGATARVVRASFLSPVRGAVAAGRDGARLALEDAAVLRATGPAASDGRGVLSVRGATLELRRVVIDGATGHGVEVATGGSAVLEDVLVARSTGTGVVADGAGSSVTLSRVGVRDVAFDPSIRSGRGVQAQMGATVTGTHVVIARAQGHGAFVGGSGATLSLDRAVVRDTGTDELGEDGAGLLAGAGGMLVVRESIVRDGANAGVASLGVGSRADVSASRIDGALHPEFGIGALAATGGSLALTGCVIAGAVATGAGADESAILRLTRTRVAAGRIAGILGVGAGTTVELADVHVEGVRGSMSVAVGEGTLTGDAVSVDGGSAGVLAYGGATVVLAGAAIRGGVESEDGLRHGEGVAAFGGATVDLARTRVERAGSSGIATHGAGTRLVAHDVLVLDVDPGPSRLYGSGVQVGEGSAAELERVLVSGAPSVAIVGVAPVSLTLRDVAVRGHPAAVSEGFRSLGIVTTNGEIDASRVVVQDVREAGMLLDRPRSAVLADALVYGVAPSVMGIAFGVIVDGDMTVRVDRLGASGVSGAALLAMPDSGGLAPTLDAHDVFVRDVRTSQIRWDPVVRAPTGPAVAYGVHAGTAATALVERAVVVDGGYGFFSAGALTLRDAVIARQADAAGGVPTETARAALALERVAYVDNATDQVRVDPALPESSALAPPTSVCAGPDCPAP